MSELGAGAWTAALVLFCALEAALGRTRGETLYTKDWTLSTAGCAALRAAVVLPLLPLFAAAYAWLGRFAPARLPAASLATWALAWLELSFLEYWIHRLEHRPGLLWALHSVHHQPEELNASVSQRSHALAALIEWPPLLLLALSGIPPETFAAVAAVHNAYGLLLHARLIGNLGWLGRVLITPAQHAVHHGTQPEHLGRNFSGSLRLWDELFATLALPTTPPRFGLMTPYQGRGVWAANLEPLACWLRARAARERFTRAREFT